MLRKETKIVKRWQQYFENSLNEENERYIRGNGISNQGVVQDISKDEIVASLGKMVKGKCLAQISCQLRPGKPLEMKA